jgi:gamma-glutamyltranspeptidase
MIVAGKRPLSSSVPTIIEKDGQLEIVIGASGGSRITTSVLQTIVNVLDWSMNIQHAISSPRVHHQLLPNEAQLENDFSDDIARELAMRGHKVIRHLRLDAPSMCLN